MIRREWQKGARKIGLRPAWGITLLLQRINVKDHNKNPGTAVQITGKMREPFFHNFVLRGKGLD
ncbi:hypothetical protein Anapl_06721 [Anas platyrhynchos]|uniref:Uncharacterized protein n=1 Tax=Anas platyrhynchos TaxID=8839 RepID=R0LPV7_ANAPL|nr:hypothetical protein Anapl_06721 [Anas platyrhynchos]